MMAKFQQKRAEFAAQKIRFCDADTLSCLIMFLSSLIICLLPSQRNILFIVPLKGLFHVVFIEIRPHGVDDEEIGVDGLHRQKAGETAASAPADYQVNAGNIVGTETLGDGFSARCVGVHFAHIPLPAIIDEEIHFDGAVAVDDPVVGV